MLRPGSVGANPHLLTWTGAWLVACNRRAGLSPPDCDAAGCGPGARHPLGFLMVLDMPHQESHRAYIAAVVAALNGAGVPVTEFACPVDDSGDLGLLRRAYINLDMRATYRLYGDQEVSLLWSDEDGWVLGWGPAGELVAARVSLCAGLLAAPREVVAAARAALSSIPRGLVPVEVRSCDDYDKGLEAALDAYTVAGGSHPDHAADEGGTASVVHEHTTETVLWGVVLLCCYEQTGDRERFVHRPVEQALWECGGEQERAWLRARVRRDFGDPAAVVRAFKMSDLKG